MKSGNCIDCGAFIPKHFGPKKRCGSYIDKTGCAQKNRLKIQSEGLLRYRRTEKFRETNRVYSRAYSERKRREAGIPPRIARRSVRKGIASKKIRFLVFLKCGFSCSYCGTPAGECKLAIDHIIPRSKGGTDDFDNLTSACTSCNSAKYDGMLDEMLDKITAPEAV